MWGGDFEAKNLFLEIDAIVKIGISPDFPIVNVEVGNVKSFDILYDKGPHVFACVWEIPNAVKILW